MIAKSNTAVMFLLVSFVISLTGCVIFAYLWTDGSVSFTYLKARHDSTVSAFNKLSSLLEDEWIGLSEHELLEKLKAEANRQGDQEIVIDTNSEEGVIWFDEIKFELESGKLKRITM